MSISIGKSIIDTDDYSIANNPVEVTVEKNVNIFITYSPKLINETKIDELKEKFNNNN